MSKYVIIAYLKQIKLFKYPYDFYICKDYQCMIKNLEIIDNLICKGTYRNYIVYKEYKLK